MSIDPQINSRLRECRPPQEVADEGSLDDARELHCWAACFDQEFGLGLPTPVIFIDHVRVPAPGHRPGCNGGGPLPEVQVDRADLDLPPLPSGERRVTLLIQLPVGESGEQAQTLMHRLGFADFARLCREMQKAILRQKKGASQPA